MLTEGRIKVNERGYCRLRVLLNGTYFRGYRTVALHHLPSAIPLDSIIWTLIVQLGPPGLSQTQPRPRPPDPGPASDRSPARYGFNSKAAFTLFEYPMLTKAQASDRSPARYGFNSNAAFTLFEYPMLTKAPGGFEANAILPGILRDRIRFRRRYGR